MRGLQFQALVQLYKSFVFPSGLVKFSLQSSLGAAEPLLEFLCSQLRLQLKFAEYKQNKPCAKNKESPFLHQQPRKNAEK